MDEAKEIISPPNKLSTPYFNAKSHATKALRPYSRSQIVGILSISICYDALPLTSNGAEKQKSDQPYKISFEKNDETQQNKS